MMEMPLPWQQAQWQQLWRLASEQRLPHALLIVGAAGLGKHHFAASLSQALLCRAASGQPCGVCSSCLQLQAGVHSDYRLLKPEDNSKSIKVDQIRVLIEFFVRTSQSGRKIALLSPADSLNTNAANALLKTLEEPAPGSLLILVSSAPNHLPATVRSRCQRLLLQTPSSADSKAWLQQHLPAAVDADVELWLRLSADAPLAALALAENGSLAQRRELFELYLTVLNGRCSAIAAAVRWTELASPLALNWLLSWQMDMIRLTMCGATTAHTRNIDLLPALLQLGANVSRAELFQRYQAALQLVQASASQLNQQLLLEEFFSRCAQTASPPAFKR